MDDKKGFLDDELSKEVTIDGCNLTIITRRVEDNKWDLSVVNEYGVSNNWIDYFSTAQEAVNYALTAIKEEGVEEFIGHEDFGYLYD